jgi:hypothetical protein
MELAGVLRHIASLIGICLIIDREHCSHSLDFKISHYLQPFALISTGMPLFPLINHYRQGWYQYKHAFMGMHFNFDMGFRNRVCLIQSRDALAYVQEDV